MHSNDPGWRPALRRPYLLLIPQLAVRHAQSAGEPKLIVLRRVFASFVLSLVGIGIVVALLAPGQPSQDNSMPLALGALTFGAVAIAITPMIGPRLDGTDASHLATTYWQRFFYRCALANVPALLGFVGFFLTGGWWLYPLGATISAVGLVQAAPTARNLAADQERLDEQGTTTSLLAALGAGQTGSAPGPVA